MKSELMIGCTSFLVLYYMIATVRYFYGGKNTEFFQMVIFPLPIAVLLVFIYLFYFYLESITEYNIMVAILITVSVFVGMFILYHCFLDTKKRDRSFSARLLTAVILIITPLLFYSPDYISFMTIIYIICGIVIGTFGFSIYLSDKRIGLLYVYTSLVFIVIIPIISYTVTKFYLDNFEPEIIYRRARDDFITCHLPAAPIIPGPDGTGLLMLFTGMYVVMIGALTSKRKNRLEKNFRNQGVIPEEYYEIIQNEEIKP